MIVITKEHQKHLRECYKYVFHCEKCGRKYGSDKDETLKQLCPLCDDRYKNAFKKKKKHKKKINKKDKTKKMIKHIKNKSVTTKKRNQIFINSNNIITKEEDIKHADL